MFRCRDMLDLGDMQKLIKSRKKNMHKENKDNNDDKTKEIIYFKKAKMETKMTKTNPQRMNNDLYKL